MSRKDESKLGPTISFRISARAKTRFDLLPIEQKHVAYRNLRVAIARAIYDSKFDPRTELDEDEE